MNIGAFRHRLTVEAPVEAPDGMGGVARAYAGMGEVWGRVEPLGGAERLAEDRLAQRLTHRITVRAVDGLTAAHRFRTGGRVFDIRAVRPDEPQPGFQLCHCEEVAP